MSLQDQLRLLRQAAHSLGDVQNRAECLDLIRKGPPYDQMFFGELSDPKWLPLLSESGFFSQLPEPITTSEGMIRYPPHLPLIALSRLGATAPAEVTQILEHLDLPANPQVSDQVMRAIAAIEDVSFANRLTPVLQKLVGGRSSSDWLWLDDILTRWLGGGATDACVEILRACLKAAIGAGDAQSRFREDWQISKIDREVIAPIAKARPLEVARLMFDSLNAWAESERLRIAKDDSYYGDYDPTAHPDYDHPSTYWLEAFGSRSIGYHDLESALAHRIYSIGRAIFESGDTGRVEIFDVMLRGSRWHLFRRLRWQLYADFPAHSLALARKDTLERIPRLGEEDFRHGYEFAAMVGAQAKQHGSAFLGVDEVNAFVGAVLAGPITKDGRIETDDYCARFRLIQLNPIRNLLGGDALTKFSEFSKRWPDLPLSIYKPFSSGGEARTIEHIPPARADAMPAMTDQDLWDFLNGWEPEETRRYSERWWVEEHVGALADKFAEYVESTPSRFGPETKWWRNLHRPVILHKPLERATHRLGKKPEERSLEIVPPTSADWRNWFGLASWIIEQSSVIGAIADAGDSKNSDKQPDWNWSRIVVVKFLTTALHSPSLPPEDLRTETGRMLRKLVEDPDPRLEASKPSITDWLTTAINSVRGTAIEGLLELALSQKKTNEHTGPDSWILDVLTSRLTLPEESPAVFAIVGAHLRLSVYLFSEGMRSAQGLLLPPDRPMHRGSFLVAHFLYDNPMSGIIQTLPDLPQAALQWLENLAEGDEKERRRGGRDFGSGLGTHLSFYYWNAAFRDQATADRTLDQFFEIAKAESRATTIGQIARIFEKSPPIKESADLYERVMNLWDRRFANIEKAIDSGTHSPTEFHGELSEFIDWLECECFPFAWRFDRTMKAINRLEKGPTAYSLVETLENLTSSGQRIDEAIRILHALTAKASNEMRWSYREKHLKPVLERGLGSPNRNTRRLTEETQEMLLRQGFFEYLDLEAKQ